MRLGVCFEKWYEKKEKEEKKTDNDTNTSISNCQSPVFSLCVYQRMQ